MPECCDCGALLDAEKDTDGGRCASCAWEFLTDLMTCNAHIRSGECGEIACDRCPVKELR